MARRNISYQGINMTSGLPQYTGGIDLNIIHGVGSQLTDRYWKVHGAYQDRQTAVDMTETAPFDDSVELRNALSRDMDSFVSAAVQGDRWFTADAAKAVDMAYRNFIKDPRLKAITEEHARWKSVNDSIDASDWDETSKAIQKGWNIFNRTELRANAAGNYEGGYRGETLPEFVSIGDIMDKVDKIMKSFNADSIDVDHLLNSDIYGTIQVGVDANGEPIYESHPLSPNSRHPLTGETSAALIMKMSQGRKTLPASEIRDFLFSYYASDPKYQAYISKAAQLDLTRRMLDQQNPFDQRGSLNFKEEFKNSDGTINAKDSRYLLSHVIDGLGFNFEKALRLTGNIDVDKVINANENRDYVANLLKQYNATDLYQLKSILMSDDSLIEKYIEERPDFKNLSFNDLSSLYIDAYKRREMTNMASMLGSLIGYEQLKTAYTYTTDPHLNPNANLLNTLVRESAATNRAANSSGNSRGNNTIPIGSSAEVMGQVRNFSVYDFQGTSDRRAALEKDIEDNRQIINIWTGYSESLNRATPSTKDEVYDNVASELGINRNQYTDVNKFYSDVLTKTNERLDNERVIRNNFQTQMTAINTEHQRMLNEIRNSYEDTWTPIVISRDEANIGWLSADFENWGDKDLVAAAKHLHGYRSDANTFKIYQSTPGQRISGFNRWTTINTPSALSTVETPHFTRSAYFSGTSPFTPFDKNYGLMWVDTFINSGIRDLKTFDEHFNSPLLEDFKNHMEKNPDAVRGLRDYYNRKQEEYIAAHTKAMYDKGAINSTYVSNIDIIKSDIPEAEAIMISLSEAFASSSGFTNARIVDGVLDGIKNSITHSGLSAPLSSSPFKDYIVGFHPNQAQGSDRRAFKEDEVAYTNVSLVRANVGAAGLKPGETMYHIDYLNGDKKSLGYALVIAPGDERLTTIYRHILSSDRDDALTIKAQSKIRMEIGAMSPIVPGSIQHAPANSPVYGASNLGEVIEIASRGKAGDRIVANFQSGASGTLKEFGIEIINVGDSGRPEYKVKLLTPKATASNPDRDIDWNEVFRENPTLMSYDFSGLMGKTPYRTLDQVNEDIINLLRYDAWLNNRNWNGFDVLNFMRNE